MASDDPHDSADDDPENPADGDAGEEPRDETDTESALQTILGGAGWVFGGRLTKLLLLFVVEILMARLLGSSSYGGVVLADMVLGLGAMIGGLGMAAGLSRNVAHYEDDPPAARGVLRAGVGLSALGSLVVGGLVFAFARDLATLVFGDPALETLFRLAAVGIPFAVLVNVGVGVASGSRDAKTHVAVRQLVRPAAEFAFITGLVLLGYDALGAVTGKVLATVLAAVVALVLARRYLRVDVQGPAEAKYREMLAFSLPLVFSSGTAFLISNTDTFLVGTYLASTHVGAYNAAFQLKQLGMLFFFPATFLITPVFARLDRVGAGNDARRTYQIVTKWSTFATVPLFVLLVGFPEVVVSTTFGAGYTGATTALQVFAIPILATVLLGANGSALVALGHTRIQMYVNGGLALLNLGLNLLLIPPLGITGAAVASAIALVGRDVLFTGALYRWHGIQPFTRALLGPLAAVSVVAPVAYLGFVRLVPVTAVSVAGVGLLALVPYAVLVAVAGGFEADDAAIVARLEATTNLDLGGLAALVKRLRL